MNLEQIVAAYTSTPQNYDVVRNAWDGVKAKYPQIFDGDDIGTETGPGWWPLLIDAFEKIAAVLVQNPKVSLSVAQIKEKFGTLRFYVDISGATPEVREQFDAIITEAEHKSCITCEYCGKPGERRSGGWIQTLCDEHEAMQAAERAARGY